MRACVMALTILVTSGLGLSAPDLREDLRHAHSAIPRLHRAYQLLIEGKPTGHVEYFHEAKRSGVRMTLVSRRDEQLWVVDGDTLRARSGTNIVAMLRPSTLNGLWTRYA